MQFERSKPFTQDVAILSSSLALADKICEPGLVAYSHDHPKKDEVIRVLMFCFNEIQAGEVVGETPMQATLEAVSIVTYLLLKHLASEGKAVTLPPEEEYEAVVVGLPAVNAEFFFDVVAAMDLNKEFLAILNSVDLTTGCTILKEYSSLYANQPYDAYRLHQLLFIFEYLSLTFNPYLNNDILRNLLPILHAHKIRRLCKEYPQFHSRLLVAWIPLFHLLVSQSNMSLSMANFNLAIDDVRILLPNDVSFVPFVIERDLSWEETRAELDQDLIEVMKKIVYSLSNLNQSAVQASLLTDGEDDDPEFDTFLALVAPRSMIVAIRQHTLLESYNSLVTVGGSDVAAVLPLFDGLIQVIQTFQAAQNAQQNQPPVLFEKSLYVIRNGVHCTADTLKWTCECRHPSILLDPRWRVSLIDHIKQFANESCMHSLLRNLVHWQDIQNEQIQSLLKEVLLDIFSACNLSTKNQLLYEVYHEVQERSALCPRANELDLLERNLKILLNRLVAMENIPAKEQGVLDELCVIAIQTPALVIRELILAAVQSKGQIRIVAQVFIYLFNLCTVQNCDRMGLLIQELKKIISNFTATEPGERNVFLFCRALLYAQNGTLIKRPEFIYHIIVPSLSAPARKGKTIVQILPILDVVIELVPTINLHLMGRAQFFPLIIYLSRFLHHFRFTLGDSEEIDCNLKIKDFTLICLQKICAKLLLHKGDIKPSVMQWLIQQTRQLHWSVQLHLHPLLTLDRIPLPKIFGSTLDNYVSNPTEMSDVFVLARSCSTGLHLARTGLDLSKIITLANAHMMLLVLIQLLPVSTGDEWLRMATFLKHLVESSEFDYAAYAFRDVEKQWLVGHLFYTAIRCIHQSFSDDVHLNDTLFPHLTRCFANTVKTVLVSPHVNGNILLLFAESVILLNTLPEPCSHTLQVLILDLIANISNFETSVPVDATQVIPISQIIFNIGNADFKEIVAKTVQIQKVLKEEEKK